MPPNPTPSQGEVPKYRITAPCYVNDTLYEQHQIDNAGDKGITIFFQGIPAPHMVPLNAAAKAMVAQHPEAMRSVDPLHQFTVIAEAAAPAPAAAPPAPPAGDPPAGKP